MSKSLLGYALFCFGGVCAAFAGGRYTLGEMQRQEARRAWEEHEAQVVVALARSKASTRFDSRALLPGAPVARLRIPRLRLDEIVLEGVGDNELNAGPGHVIGSVFPGEKGNSVISAHRDRHFSRLGALQVGDTLITETGWMEMQWVVVSKRVVSAETPALFRTGDPTLTLTTCWPIRYIGSAPDRLIVTAKPVVPAGNPSFATASAT
jgi:sortase A